MFPYYIIFIIVLVSVSALFAFMQATPHGQRGNNFINMSRAQLNIASGKATAGDKITMFLVCFFFGLITPLYIITSGILSLIITIVIALLIR